MSLGLSLAGAPALSPRVEQRARARIIRRLAKEITAGANNVTFACVAPQENEAARIEVFSDKTGRSVMVLKIGRRSR